MSGSLPLFINEQKKLEKFKKLSMWQLWKFKNEVSLNCEDDLPRAALLTYYKNSKTLRVYEAIPTAWKRFWLPGEVKEIRRLCLWLISNKPNSSLFSIGTASISNRIDPEGYTLAEQSWDRKISEEPFDLQIMRSYFDFFFEENKQKCELAVKLVLANEPLNLEWKAKSLLLKYVYDATPENELRYQVALRRWCLNVACLENRTSDAEILAEQIKLYENRLREYP